MNGWLRAAIAFATSATSQMLLLQATMYRHTERYEEAQLVLDKLQLLQDSRYWYAEIETEKALLAVETNRAIDSA